MVGYHIGSRRGEMLKLKWKNVDLQRGTIFFPGKTTKNGEGRIVPIWGPMGECLREQLRIRDELLSHRRGGCSSGTTTPGPRE